MSRPIAGRNAAAISTTSSATGPSDAARNFAHFDRAASASHQARL